MAEAAGLAVGVVSLGIQIVNGITNYVDALNCRDKDIASVRCQNDALQALLNNIEASLSRFQTNPEVAMDAVRECLESCKKELGALESTVADLTACDKSEGSRKEKLKREGKKLLYPFSRPKVEQLEARLASANATLQLALQTLGLSVSQLSVERLAALQATSHTISFSLEAAQAKVSSIDAPIQNIDRAVSGFGTRFDTLETLLTQLLANQQAGEGLPQRNAPAVAAGRLLEKPGLLKDVCDAAGVGAKTGPREALQAPDRRAARPDRTVSAYTGGRFSCMCRHRRRLRRKNAAWGPLTLSFEEAYEQHLPGCPATEVLVTADRSQKFSLTYTGLRRVLNSAIQVSFALPWGAGAGSLGPTFAYYPTVDVKTAPAFRILSLMTGSSLRFGGELSWEAFIESAVSAILRAFQTGKASPRAVDAHNRSLVYHLANFVRGATFTSRPSPDGAAHCALLELLECLLVNKAPANDYDLSGDTPINIMLDPFSLGTLRVPLLPAAADLILQSNVEANVAWLPGSRARRTPGGVHMGSGRNLYNGENFLAYLRFLSSSTKIAEAYGCGPLSLAVLSGDAEQVQHLVRKHPATLAERDLFGHTPLHLGAGNPSCLRLLVEAADAALLNQPDNLAQAGKSALETAVILSRRRCREPSSSRLCRRCACAECAVILLKADCALPAGECLQFIFNNASKRCRRKYIRHVRDRRDRLEQLALDNLTATEVERLGLASGRVLDALAPQVTQLLVEHGVHVPEALALERNHPHSVYQAIRGPEDAELFFRAGFHDTDSWCKLDPPTLRYTPGGEEDLAYLHWLAMHGATSFQLESLTSAGNILTTRLLFFRIGDELWWGGPLLPGHIDWIHDLHSAALPAGVADSCRCRCSPGGCTPFTALLEAEISRLDKFEFDVVTANSAEDDSSESKGSWPANTAGTVIPPDQVTGLTGYLTHFGHLLDVGHHFAALRYMTFAALDVPHACCKPVDLWRPSSRYKEHAAEVQEEYADDLALLEDLLAEFEGEVATILQDPGQGIAGVIDFWERSWVRRMWEILDSLEGDDLRDDERREAEEIGVVWDRPQPQSLEVRDNPYEWDSPAWYMYELKTIEAECE